MNSDKILHCVKCHLCGTLNPSDSVYCIQCGAGLDNEPKQARDGAAAADSRKAALSRLAVIAILVAIVALSAAGIMIYKMNKPGDSASGGGKVGITPATAQTGILSPAVKQTVTPVQTGTPPVSPAGELPTPAPLNPVVRRINGEPELSGLQLISVRSAEASSTIHQDDHPDDFNSAMKMFDGKEDTSWQEGVDGYGIGETVRIDLDGTYEICYMGFKLGNWKNEDWYRDNARPAGLRIKAGSISRDIFFTGEDWVTEWIELKDTEPADSVSLEILDYYPGLIYDDTCITDIYIYGKEVNAQ